jgi:sarcosine/dimethylglycine N-methyltransferase
LRGSHLPSEPVVDAWGENLHCGLFRTPDDSLEAAAERTIEFLCDAAGVQAGDRVLETACGIGGTARYLARKYGVHVLATNISEAQLELGRALTEREGLDSLVRFEHADFQDLPYDDDAFDGYWLMDSAFYAQDKARLVREAFRVLKPNGRFVLTEETERTPMEPHVARELTSGIGTPGFWSWEAWQQTLEAAGFVDLQTWDWSEHGQRTVEVLLERLLEQRARTPAAEVEQHNIGLPLTGLAQAIARFQCWVKGFRGGQIGWWGCVARKPALT